MIGQQISMLTFHAAHFRSIVWMDQRSGCWLKRFVSLRFTTCTAARGLQSFERSTHLIFLPRRLVILMALGDDPLLLLHRRNLTLDDGVQLLAHIILNVHLVVHDFTSDCLLELRCLVEFSRAMTTTVIVRFQKSNEMGKNRELGDGGASEKTKERFRSLAEQKPSNGYEASESDLLSSRCLRKKKKTMNRRSFACCVTWALEVALNKKDFRPSSAFTWMPSVWRSRNMKWMSFDHNLWRYNTKTCKLKTCDVTDESPPVHYF